MKKIISFLLVSTLMFITLNIFSVRASDFVTTDSPELGVIDNTADFNPNFFPNHIGSKRIGEQSVELTISSGFGVRGHFNETYDITDFSFETDLTLLRPNCALTVILGGPSAYPTAGAAITLEIIKHPTNVHDYLVVIGNANPHNESFLEIRGGDQWNDPAWKGVYTVAENDMISISMVETGDNYNFTINGNSYTVPTATVFANGIISDKTKVNVSVGIMNNDGTVQSIIFNKLEDAYRRDYYSNSGTFGTVKAALEAYESSLNEDLTVENNVINAQNLKKQINFTGLYTYDINYFTPRFEAANVILDNAVKVLGPITAINIAKDDVISYENQSAELTTLSSIENAYVLKNIAETKITQLRDLEGLNEELNGMIDDLESRISTCNNLLLNASIEMIESQVSAYENKVTSLSTIEDLKNARLLKDEISYSLLANISEEQKTIFETRINAAKTSFDSKTKTINSDWLIGEFAGVIVNNNQIYYSGIDSFVDKAAAESNGIFYTKEKFEATNFSMIISINEITKNTGGWLSFGLMENAEPFIIAEDTTVQDNKGLFFLIIPQANNTAKVEIYQCSLYSNRFFDSKKTEELTIDLTKDIEIKFSTEKITKAGVEEEYLSISIGGQKMTQDLIKVSGLKTSLGVDNQGYLYFGTNSASSDYPTTLVIKSINGKNPNSSDLSALPLVDPNPEPNPNPGTDTKVDDENHFPTEIVVVCSVLAVGAIGGLSYFFIFKRK